MSEWWTYGPGDLLMFSPQAYRRLFGLYNDAFWPLQALPLLCGFLILGSLVKRGTAPGRGVAVVLASSWLWIAWAFHAERYATINWVATWFAWAFAIEGVLIAALAGVRTDALFEATPPLRARLAIALLVVALAYPILQLAAGRALRESEFFGFAPDPTAIGTLGLLMLARGGDAWMLRIVPLAWCIVGGTTLATMHDPHAWWLIGAAAVALASAFGGRRRRTAG